MPVATCPSPPGPKPEVLAVSKDPEFVRQLFQDAIQEFERVASPKEKKWLQKAYKHDENKPPEELEEFRAYLLTYDERLNNGIIKRLYDSLSNSEGLLRGLAFATEVGLGFVPEPYSSPVNLVCRLTCTRSLRCSFRVYLLTRHCYDQSRRNKVRIQGNSPEMK